jgi:hypothetical protein
MAGDPRLGASAPGLQPGMVRINDEDYLAATFPVRAGALFSGASASADGITYRIEGARGLRSWDAPVAECSPARAEGLPPLPDGWSYRTFRLTEPVSADPSASLRLRVSQP